MKRGLVVTVFLALILVFIFSFSVVSATFTAGKTNHSIDAVYGPGANVTGWINISLANESANSSFSVGNTSVKLLDLLNQTDGMNYTCNPGNCKSVYTSSNGQATKAFSLGSGASGLYGLRFTGNPVNVNSVSFNFQSDANASCTNQIKIDLLDDGVIDFTNNKSSGASCSGKNYGCYDPTASTVEYSIGINNNAYCQEINLSEAPSFAVGAWIKNVSGSMSFHMQLKDENGEQKGDCALPNVTDTAGAEVSCIINYTLSKPGKHYVCVYTTTTDGEYRLKGYLDSERGCGYPGIATPPPSTPASYQIFAQAREYGAPGTLQIANSLPDGNTLGSEIQDYILSQYGNTNCDNECVVPIRFISGTSQSITLSNLIETYQNQGGTTTENKFYNIVETPARVSSGFNKIYLSLAGFTVPNTVGAYTFLLKLGSNNIFTERLDVKDVPKIQSLTPRTTAAAFPTDFKVSLNGSSSNITSYRWDFGDNTTVVTTQTNTTKHTYLSTGIYNVTVRVVDIRQLTAEKTFEVNVSSPKTLIESRLASTKAEVEDLKTQLGLLDLFTRTSVDSILHIDNVSADITRLQNQYSLASTDQEYSLIVAELLQINLPEAITETRQADSITFLPEKSTINPEVLGALNNETYNPDQATGYVDAIVAWDQQNLDTKVDFSEVSGKFGTSIEPIIRTFVINIKEKKDISEDYFFIIPKLDGLQFEPGVVTVDAGDYVYVNMANRKEIAFSTTSDVDFATLPAYISPGISALSVVEVSPETKLTRWPILVLAIGLLLLIAFMVYIALAEWYKRRYENYLFKSRNDLYNMVTYLNNAKKKGMKNPEIAENLRKAKWSSEQVAYVMKKYAGKNTGLPGMAFFNLFRREK